MASFFLRVLDISAIIPPDKPISFIKEKKRMNDKSVKVRNGAIDFWKFVFSILVVQFHSSNLTEIKTTPFVGAAIAVEWFFLVSDGGIDFTLSGRRYCDRSRQPEVYAA